MASNRAFRNLASLRHSFDEPLADDSPAPQAEETQAPSIVATASAAPSILSTPAPMLVRSYDNAHPISPITGKVDRRRLKKVLKTPSISLSVAVRAELHEEVSTMLFARKSTWIALLDQLLTDYVADAKANSNFPK